MHHSHTAPPVVVGIDGSPDAWSAAVWAVDEAASRDLPLKLVYVIHQPGIHQPGFGGGPAGGVDKVSAANAALSQARDAVQAVEPTVKVETEVLWGNPLSTLIGLSQSATMLCAGSIGIEQICHRAGSTAAALAGAADCPVAVIHHPPRQHVGTGYIVAEVDVAPENNDVLGWAMAEARLREAPLRLVVAGEPARRAQLDRRVEHWAGLYPDVDVETITVPSVADYLAENAESVRLFISGTRDRRSIGEAGGAAGCSVLTVGGRPR